MIHACPRQVGTSVEGFIASKRDHVLTARSRYAGAGMKVGRIVGVDQGDVAWPERSRIRVDGFERIVEPPLAWYESGAIR